MCSGNSFSPSERLARLIGFLAKERLALLGVPRAEAEAQVAHQVAHRGRFQNHRIFPRFQPLLAVCPSRISPPNTRAASWPLRSLMDVEICVAHPELVPPALRMVLVSAGVGVLVISE